MRLDTRTVITPYFFFIDTQWYKSKLQVPEGWVLSM